VLVTNNPATDNPPIIINCVNDLVIGSESFCQSNITQIETKIPSKSARNFRLRQNLTALNQLRWCCLTTY
jgi:hypothetical protein